MSPALFPEAAFTHCPRCGAAGLTSPKAGMVQCPACDLHFYLNTATAVAVLLADPQGRLLMIERQKDPEKGKLALPGGFVDFGETAEQAVAREALEEVNLRVTGLEFLCSHPNRYDYRGITYRTLDFFFLGQVEDWTTLRALDEVAGLGFHAAQEIRPVDIAFPSIRAAVGHWQRTYP